MPCTGWARNDSSDLDRPEGEWIAFGAVRSLHGDEPERSRMGETNLEIGVVCGSCDGYSPVGTVRCAFCDHELALPKPPARLISSTAVSAPPAVGPLPLDEPAPASGRREPPPPSSRREPAPHIASAALPAWEGAIPLSRPVSRPPPSAEPVRLVLDGVPQAPVRAPLESLHVTPRAPLEASPPDFELPPRSRPDTRPSTRPSAGPESRQEARPSKEPRSITSNRLRGVPSELRRGATRPQAPELLGALQIPSTASLGVPRVEVLNRSDLGSVPPNQESWGRETPGRIPLHLSRGRSKEELMDQARNYVCRSCSTPIPSGHKFCGRCGAAVPPDVLTMREEFYGPLQIPGRAKLILIRADGDAAMEGLSFALNAQEHIVGRQGHLTFPEDRFVSPRHANLYYRDGTLVVRDEGSLNGVYVRIRGTVDARPGDMFLAGEEVFRIDATPKASDHPDADGTYFWSSPKRPSPFRVAQVLAGGATGNVVTARETAVAIGREGGDMNFPTDVYMSALHCRVEAETPSGKLVLTDLGSRNGTYLRLRAERDLSHGDYLFIGKKILRVEVTS